MTRKSPDLEVISNNASGERAPHESKERRRRPRLNLTGEQFRLDQNGKIFSVADLSPEGMAFRILDSEDLRALPVASEISGTLNLRGEKLAVRARVKHLSPRIVGCEFMALDASVRERLAKLLDPEALGREIRPLPASDPGTLWYHGPSGTDLILSRGLDGQYRRIILYALGSFIQWDCDSGLMTGTVASDDRGAQRSEDWGIVQFETMLVDADQEPDLEKLSVAKALILSSNLPEDLKKWCARQLAVTLN